MRSILVAFACLPLALASACGGAYGSLGMAEDGLGTGSGDEGTGESGEPTPDVPAESACQAQSLTVEFEVTVDEGPNSFADAITFEGDEILVGSVANGAPALSKLASDGGLLWEKIWPEFEGERVRIDLDESGASGIFAGLPDGYLTALLDSEGEPVWERMVPVTAYDFHPASVDVYWEEINVLPPEPGTQSIQVRRAAWRTNIEEPDVGLLDDRAITNGGADVWNHVFQEPAPVHVEALASGELLNGGPDLPGVDYTNQIIVGAEGDSPWVASYSEWVDFDAVVDAGAPAMFTSVVIGADATATLGGVCESQGQRWGWIARTDGAGNGLEDATGACPKWAGLNVPPIANLAVTDDDVVIAVSHDTDTLALIFPNQIPEFVSLSALLGHDVSPRAVASAGTCDFVVTGRVDADGSSFVARLSGG